MNTILDLIELTGLAAGLAAARIFLRNLPQQNGDQQ